jgi:primosomal protein N' (replication factor Y)
MSLIASSVVAVAQVEPLTTTRRLSGPFDYALPAEPLVVGSVVRVPFGHQRLDGVVVGLAEESELPAERLVAPSAVREDSVPPDLVALALWMASEYASTPARALSLVLPPPGKPRTRLWARRTDASLEGERLSARQRALLERLPGAAGADLGSLRRLEGRGLVALESRAERREPLTRPPADRTVELTSEQATALDAVEAGGAHLLHGVTGSGKTEVYLRAAEAALARGEGVIVLVPEIALTPQTVGRFQARFGDTVALLHSALGEGERYDEWRRLRSGEARIAVGPRSAVFAPVVNLGLVVVDEEHDASYKHEGDPRYDARRVAAERARRAGARLLVGSATPRPESWRAMPRLTLRERADGRPLPPVRVLDMRGGSGHPLHPETRRALGDARKSIVLLNRRGWSNFLTCRTCGKVWECPQCDVALVLHRAQGAIACHHCGHREPVPQRCDACGSLAVARYGAGTERIEHDLTEALDVPVFRLDADTAATKDAVPDLLARFDAAPAGLLLGTQMVAKGHDFPDVTLGVVLDADSTLRFPDFRAEERTFALIAQLAGRAGRGPRGGHVLVQTSSPDAPAILAAAQHDTEGFVTGELGRREALRYPPFSDLIRIVFLAEDGVAARAAAGYVGDALARRAGEGSDVLGPAPLFRLRGRDRFQLVVKTQRREAAIAAVGSIVERAARDRAHRHVAFSVDVDPQ